MNRFFFLATDFEHVCVHICMCVVRRCIFFNIFVLLFVIHFYLLSRLCLKGNQQHDAQEFLYFLLDALHEVRWHI